AARRAEPDRVRREHVGLRARQRGRRLFQRLSRLPGRGMHLRPRRVDAQGQPVRLASQIRRCHACRRGRGASRRHASGPRCGMRRARAFTHACAGTRVSVWTRCALLALLVLLAALALAQAEPVSFAGKQMKLMIGYSPTGYGYDTYGRLIARHLGKYLPGNPTIIPQNRPGAGSLNPPTISITRPPRTAARLPSSAAAWRWSRSSALRKRNSIRAASYGSAA